MLVIMGTLVIITVVNVISASDFPCNMWRYEERGTSNYQLYGTDSGPMDICRGSINVIQSNLSRSSMYHCINNELYKTEWMNSHNCSGGYITSNEKVDLVYSRGSTSHGRTTTYQYECNKDPCDYAVVSDYGQLCDSDDRESDYISQRLILINNGDCQVFDTEIAQHFCNSTHFKMYYYAWGTDECIITNGTAQSPYTQSVETGSIQCINDWTELFTWSFFKGKVECHFNNTGTPTTAPTQPTIASPTAMPVTLQPSLSPTPECDEDPFECSDGTIITKYYSRQQMQCVWPDCNSDSKSDGYSLKAMYIVPCVIFVYLLFPLRW